MNFLAPPKHIMEQSVWRLSQIQDISPVCAQMGQCKVCGCSVDEKVFEDRKCEGGCYPGMMDATQWGDFKLKNNIIVDL